LILPAPSALADGPASFTLADLGEKDIAVRTVFDQVKVNFPVAAGRRITTAQLRLHLAHDQKLLPNLSDLTVALNDEPVINLPLTPDNAAKNFIDVPRGTIACCFSFNCACATRVVPITMMPICGHAFTVIRRSNSTAKMCR
jgi:hypothetical protein